MGHVSSPILDRLEAACKWGSEANEWKDSSGVEAHVEALRLLDLASAQGYSLEKKYVDLRMHGSVREVSAIAVNAAALALESGRSALAVRLLEQGRGVIFRQLGNLRAELDDIRLVDPHLADVFESLSKQLETLAVSSSQTDSEVSSAQALGVKDGLKQEASDRVYGTYNQKMAARSVPLPFLTVGVH